MVRALGLEPSLFRGKSPVPHQSGVTRIGAGRGRAPASDDGCAPGRVRPVWGQMALAPIDVSSVVKVLVPDGCRTNGEAIDGSSMPRIAGSEGVEPPAAGVGSRGAALARAQEHG